MKRILLFLFVSIYLISCNEESSPVNNDNPSNSPYSGLMWTNDLGQIDSTDDDDWSPLCYNIPSFGENFFCLYPPISNPGTDKITIRLANRLNGSYRITVHQSDRVPIDTLWNDILPTGNNSFEIIYSEKYERGRIYRVFIQAKDSESTAVQLRWGDIMWLELEE